MSKIAFVELLSLREVCKDIPGVDVREIQRDAFKHGLKTKQIHDIVDRIVQM